MTVDNALARKVIIAGLESVIAAEPEITKYDTEVGDGDCGVGLKRGAEGMLDDVSISSMGEAEFLKAVLDLISRDGSLEDVGVTVAQIAGVVERTMDGTSGALYA